MTNEEFQAHLDAVIGVCQSGLVEVLYGTEWRVPDNFIGINFNTPHRIKPQPRDVWIRFGLNGKPEVFMHDWENGCVKFREVIE